MANQQLRKGRLGVGKVMFLEGVRGVAAAVVVIHHLLIESFPEFRGWSEAHIDLGRVGVVAFFLVSGYVIPLSLGTTAVPAFAVRRFFRLFPAYWVALLLLLPLRPQAFTSESPLVVALNIFTLHGLIGAVSILPVAWTLSIELLFYGQAMLAKARGVLDAAVHAGWLWLALYMCISVAQRTLDRDLPVTVPVLMFTSALGHALHRRDVAGTRTWTPMLAAALVVVPLGAFVSGDVGSWQPVTFSSSYIGGLLLFGTFVAVRHAQLPRTLVWLGSISYSLYLFHLVTMALVSKARWPDTAAIPVDIVLMLVVSQLTYRFIERPTQQFGRRLTTAGHPDGPGQLVPEQRRSASTG